MKWFISQPMKGMSTEEIIKKRAEIEEQILREHPGDEIIDSVIRDYQPCGGNVALKYLSKSIEMLADADVAYFGEGWLQARGCIIEHECAVAYGITVVEEQGGKHGTERHH